MQRLNRLFNQNGSALYVRRQRVSVALFAGLMMSAALFNSCSNDDNEGIKEEPITAMPVVVKDGEKWSLVQKDGKIICRNKFEQAPSAIYNGFFTTYDSIVYSLYKYTNDSVIPVKGCDRLVSVGAMNEGLIPICRPEQRIEIIDNDGNTRFILNPYNNQEIIASDVMFKDGLLVIKNNEGKLGFVDSLGNVTIPPEYDIVSKPSNGLIVAVKDGDKTMLINRSGGVVKNFPKGWQLQGEQLQYGYFIVRDEEKSLLLVDTTGTTRKLPEDIIGINSLNNHYMVFTREGKRHGVMSVKDLKVVIRGQYQQIFLMPDDKFLCIDYNNNATILNAEGKQLLSIENYNEGFAYNDFFGLLGAKNGLIYVINDKGQPATDRTYYQIGEPFLTNLVQSDYIDFIAIGNVVKEIIQHGGFGDYIFGKSAAEILEGEAVDYQYTMYPVIEQLSASHYNYSYKTQAVFTEVLTKYADTISFDESGAKWNPNSKLSEIILEINFSRDITPEFYNHLVSVVEAEGYTLGAAYQDSEVASWVFRNNENDMVQINVGKFGGSIEMTIIVTANSTDEMYRAQVESIRSSSEGSAAA